MRVLVAAAASALFAALAAPAAAETWTHPAGLYSFERPAGWPVDTPRQQNPNMALNVAGTANNECTFMAVQRAAWSTAAPEAMRRTAQTPFTAEQWTSIASSLPSLRAQMELRASSVDETGFWPIQRADIQGADGLVHAGVQLRPGLELWTFCLSYDGRDQPALYERVIRSVATPRDGEWRAAIEAAAPPPAPPAN